LLAFDFVVVMVARRGSEAEATPKPNLIFEGVTQGGQGVLCIGTSAHDARATCAPLEYPDRKPGCVFLFKQTGGQKITARYVVSPQTVWQPLTLDGRKLQC
jgi:hypothetical protein